MDQTNTSAGTAHTPRFEQIDTRGVSLSAATMQTSDGDTIRIDRHTSTSFCLHVSGEGFEFGAWLTRPEAIATGRELLKAAGAPDDPQQLREQRDAMAAELERERMCHAACGVIAMCNTRDSAAQQRAMRPEYWTASVQEVAKAVDREMALREQRDELLAALTDFLDAQDALDNRELQGPNAECHFKLMARRNNARQYLDTVASATGGAAQPAALSYDDALRIARGCTDYGGGFRGTPHFGAYQAGIQTVISALTSAEERGLQDTQIRVLHAIGGEAA